MFGFLFQRVYLQLFLVLAGGILLGSHYPLPAPLLISSYLLLLGVVLSLGLLWWLWRDSVSSLGALPGFAALLSIGYISVSISIELPLNSPLRRHVQYEPLVMFGEVRDMPRFRDGHLRFMLAVDELRQPEAKPWEGSKIEGLCYVYLKADSPPELYTGDRVRLFASLDEAEAPRCRGQFNYRAYLLGRGTVLTAYAASEKCLTRLSSGRPWLWAWLSELRAGLTERLARHMPPELGSLAVSVVYGDKITDLPDEMRERFRKAGLTHILVASGTQVSLLIVLLAFAFLRLRNDFTWRSVLLGILQFSVSLTIVLIYAAVTGFETSIVRALSMGVLIMAGRLFSRKADGMTTLAQSALVILLVNPLQLFAPGFLLSFGATFGLIYIAGVGFPLLEGLKGWRLWVSQTLITSGGAQLYVAPVLIASFNQLSLWGLFSNLLAIPLGFALLIVGGIASLGFVQLPLIGPLLGWLTSALAHALNSVATLFSILPGANLAVPDPPLWWIAAYYALLLLVGEGIKLRTELTESERRALRLAVPLCALALWGSLLSWWVVPAPELSALNLPAAEVYLWRPASGESILLLRQSGLARGHNAENVVSALRCRGINSLSGIVWLDGTPAENPLQGYIAKSYAPGSSVPPSWDLRWESSRRGRCSGACLSLGGRTLRLVWDAAEQGGGDLHSERMQVDCSIVQGKSAGALREEGLRELSRRSAMVYLLGDHAEQADDFMQSVATELSLRPWGRGLRATAYKAAPELL